jgi:hypothetical protein
MQVVYFDSAKWGTAEKNGANKEVIKDVVDTAVYDVSQLLPPLSPYLNITVRPDKEASVKENGVGGFCWDEEAVALSFDPDIPFGVASLKKSLRGTAFHEINHAARRVAIPYTDDPVEAMIAEGIATKFEQLHTDSTPLWGEPGQDNIMQDWLGEIQALPKDEKNYDYLFDHPDGRRWIIYKVGTWLVSTILNERPDVTIQDLTIMPAEQVVQLWK